jgi:hypothetical protein
MLTADVSCGELQLVPEKVSQMHAGFDPTPNLASVDRQTNLKF